MSISLRPVTRHNFDAVVDLPLRPDQRELVAANAYSIAQASFHPNMHPRAIYADDDLVGFLMYVDLEAFGDAGEWGIWRLMIDHRHQGKGYARTALTQVIDEVRARSGTRKIWISYLPGNAVARKFYATLGFVETGIDDEGEMVAVLDVAR